METKCTGARFTGANHSVCQDEILYKNYKNISLIAVSDGAGSKSHSQIGSRLSLYCLDRFFASLDTMNPLGEGTWIDPKALKDELLYEIKTAIKLEAWKNDRQVSDYACTLVFVALVGDKYFMTGHIGDGGILELTDTGMVLISRPENGEYKNETFFVTDQDANKYFRVNRMSFHDSVKSFLICTDGIADSLFQIREQGVRVSDVAITMCSWLLKAEGEMELEKVRKALESNLKDVFSQKSHDDLSICIMSVNINSAKY